MKKILLIKLLEVIEFLYVLKKILNLKKIKISYIKSKNITTKKYIEYNEAKFKGSTGKEKLILIDCFPIPSWVIVNSFFLNKLSEKYNANIASYDICKRDVFTNKVYNSFGCNTHLVISLTKRQSIDRVRLFNQIIDSVKTKEELFNLKIDDVWIGLDIYESILALGNPTVDINSFDAKFIIFHSLKYFIFFSKLMESGRVAGVDLSHDCYIRMGLVAKLAYKYQIPVYTINALEMSKTNHVHHLYEKFQHYPSAFQSLGVEQQAAAIQTAKETLTQRLSGVVGAKMSYQVKSAFSNARIGRQTRATQKVKIVIATHCFYDNPHGLGWMLFNDFYEWLVFLGKLSSGTDYEWYIKPHADYLHGTLDILRGICKKYPSLTLIEPETTWHQLKDEGVSIVLTCYGSIGHELPLLGFKVINAAYNPHIAYDFNWHPKSIEEYTTILKDLSVLGEIRNIEKIYEFFFVHKFLIQNDSMIFQSYEQFHKAGNLDLLGLGPYELFLQNNEEISRGAEMVCGDFIKSPSTHYYETLYLKDR